MAEDDALFQKGMPIRREVLGPGICRRLDGAGRRIHDVVPAGDDERGRGVGHGATQRSTARRAV